MMKAAHAARWSVLENGGLVLISFGSLVVYARFLSAAEFGLFAIALSVIEVLTVLVSMLFHDALVQRGEARASHFDTAFTATLALSAVLVGVCWAISPLLSGTVAPVLLALAVSLPLTASSAVLVAHRRRHLDFRTLAITSLSGRALGAAVGIVLVVLGFGLWALVAQHVVFVACTAALLWARAPERPRLRFARAEFRELIGFGLACVSDLLLIFSVKRLFIVASGVLLGAHAAGVLALAFRAFDTLWAVGVTALSQVMLPILSRLQSDAERLRQAFVATVSLVCLVSYFGFVLLAATAPEVVALLFGPKWAEVAPFLTLFCLQVLTGAVRAPMAVTLKVLGRPRELVLCQTAEFAFLAAVIAAYGMPSIAWAVGIWLAREAIGTGMQVWLFGRSSVRVPFFLPGAVGVPLIGALLMFAAVSACRELLGAPSLVVLGAVGTAVYLGCVAVLDPRLLTQLLLFIQAAVRRVQVMPT